MKKIILLLFMFLGVVGMTNAQRTISGVITDARGEALIGANVLVPNSTIGTISDIDGSFSLNVPSGTTELEVSYTGFTSRLISIVGTDNVNVAMEAGQVLNEVVVTALGIERNSRDVVYANQSVSSEDLLSTPSKNALEALRGKASGVKITTGSGSVGASSKIVLRAESSLTGNNNALIVVDGIPIDNNSTGGGEGEGEGGYSDYGNRFNDINPEDIESVTILKGPSATSLYGSRGASGVVLVKTKSGSKETKINFTSTTSIEQAYVLLKRQDRFGQGLINPDGSNTFDSGENFSWGPEFDGVVRPWTSPIDADGDGDLEYLSREYSAVPNQLENFFRLGRSNINTVSISGGKEAFTYYASYGNTYQRGILENTDYKRHNITLKAGAQLTDRLSSTFGVTYANIDQNTSSEGSRAFEGNNAYANAIQAPVNIPYNEIRDYNNPFHSFGGFYGSYTVNPFFVLNEYSNNGKVNNLLANVSFKYDILDNLSFDTRVGTNLVGTQIDQSVPKYGYLDHYIWEDNLTLTSRDGRQVNAGSYLRNNINTRNIDLTSSFNHSTSFGSDDFELSSTVGFNLFDRRVNRIVAETQGGLVVPGVYNLSNSLENSLSLQDDSRYRILGFLGNFRLGYQNKLFVEYSARQDYSSTLPVDNNSFFYQAIGVSAIVTDYLGLQDNDKFNFLKLRGSYGTTGKDAGLYLLNSIYAGNPTAVEYNDVYSITFPLNGQTGFTKGSSIGNPNLKPELTTTLELGFDAGFLDDRVTLEYTFYNSVHSDQIVEVDLPRSSGFGRTALNVGEITNTGHEIALGLKPFYNRDGFQWDLNFTFATNKNKVVKISDQTDELVLWDSGRGVTLVAEEGQPFGTFKAQVPTFDPNGNPITAGGLPVYSSDVQPIGNVQPDFLAGLGTTIGYKRLSFNLLLDTRQGNEIFSLTQAATEFNGTAITSTINDRKPFIIENSVVEVKDENGNFTGEYAPNTIATLADAYVDDGNYGRRVIDGSFLKLREIGINYNIPTNFTNKINIGKSSVSLFARNVKFWLPEENSFADPEVNGPSTVQNNVTGIETSQTPPSRSYGIKLNIQF